MISLISRGTDETKSKETQSEYSTKATRRGGYQVEAKGGGFLWSMVEDYRYVNMGYGD